MLWGKAMTSSWSSTPEIYGFRSQVAWLDSLVCGGREHSQAGP